MKKSPLIASLFAALSASTLAIPHARAADLPAAKPVYFDVRSYGAAGDGKTVDTKAINDAIDAASAAGGGTVYFRAGIYPSFSIHLKSNITLYFDQGAILLAAGPILGNTVAPRGEGPGGKNIGALGPAAADGAPAYDAAEPNLLDGRDNAYQDFGHSHFHNSLMWGENLHDISLLGPGMIDGLGLGYNPPATAAGVGNKALALKNCRNVTLRDVTFYRGGHFAVLATAVDNFTVDNVKFDTIRDGIDIDSCKNVRVSNCLVNSPIDDGICLKADYALGAARVCENVTITNCQVSGYRMGTLLDGTYDRSTTNGTGRIKFGTESNGGFKNITISNCVFDHCRGFAIESVDGGIVEDVTVSNLTMREICNSPIFIRLGNRARGPADKTPFAQIRRVNISDISASGVDPNLPVLISGIPGHPIEDLRISNVRIAYKGGGTAQQATRAIPENEKDYPEPSMFDPKRGEPGPAGLSASAFFIRHVKGLEMHHIDVTFDKPDARPVFVLDDVNGADFQHMKLQKQDGIPFFSLNNVKGFSTQFVQGIADMQRDAVEKELISK